MVERARQKKTYGHQRQSRPRKAYPLAQQRNLLPFIRFDNNIHHTTWVTSTSNHKEVVSILAGGLLVLPNCETKNITVVLDWKHFVHRPLTVDITCHNLHARSHSTQEQTNIASVGRNRLNHQPSLLRP